MPQLKKELTRFDLTMIAIGSMIGSGIFLTPSIIARAIPFPSLIIFVWLIGGLQALCGALTFAELGALMPGAGGVYVFLSEGYGKLAGFLYGWAYFLVVNTGGIAALSVAFATYLGYFVHLDPLGIKIVAVSGIFILTVINVFGVKIGGIFSDIFTLLKLLGIFGVILTGFLLGSSHITNFSISILNPETRWSGIAIAMVGVLWSYGGWQHATYTAGEAKNPKRDVPIAMIIAASAVTAIYISINIAYMFLLPVNSIASSSSLAADAVKTVIGPVGGGLIALAIFISTFGTAGIYTLTAPRIYFAMASDGIFFKQVSLIHPKYSTPYYAIIFQSTWAIILVLLWGTFENLISYVVFTDWIFFALTAATIFIFRKKLPDEKRDYKTFGYPFTPLFFIMVAVWFVINTLIEKPEQAIAGIIMLGLGLPVYYYWKKKNKMPSN
ncbi:MAG: amino acid permease [Bacteroidetes bacterium]|nr:amino acid permease [Bacteroidota bacterium]